MKDFTIRMYRDLNFDLEENAKLIISTTNNPPGDWVGIACVLRLMFEEGKLGMNLEPIVLASSGLPAIRVCGIIPGTQVLKVLLR